MRLAMLVLASWGFGCATLASDEFHRVAVGGTELAYAIEGAGPPLLLIHGAGGDLRGFSLVAPPLARARTVIRVSLRLHWPNRWPATEQEAYDSYTVENHAADVAALIGKLGLGPVELLGHSYGGVVAVELARTHPELVRRLILVEPALFGILRERPAGQRLIAEAVRERDATLAALRAGQPPLEILRGANGAARFDALPEWRRRIVIDNAPVLGPDLARDRLDYACSCADAGRLAMPVLVVEGGKSEPALRAIDSVLLGCLHDGRKVVFPASGHSIPVEAPGDLARAVLGFVAG